MTHHPLPEQQPLFRYSVVRSDGQVELTVAGEIDLSCEPELRRALLSATDASTAVVVDLAAVSFMDSSGLHALLTARRHLSERGIDLRLRNPSPITRRVLHVSGVEPLFSIVG